MAPKRYAHVSEIQEDGSSSFAVEESEPYESAEEHESNDDVALDVFAHWRGVDTGLRVLLFLAWVSTVKGKSKKQRHTFPNFNWNDIETLFGGTERCAEGSPAK